MKSRLVNISRHPSCEGARGRERQEERKGGNMRGGILLFLNPNSRIRAGSRSMLEHTIAHTICIPPTLREHTEEQPVYKMPTHYRCTHGEMYSIMCEEKMQRNNRQAENGTVRPPLVGAFPLDQEPLFYVCSQYSG